jgi:hypothetical protein
MPEEFESIPPKNINRGINILKSKFSKKDQRILAKVAFPVMKEYLSNIASSDFSSPGVLTIDAALKIRQCIEDRNAELKITAIDKQEYLGALYRLMVYIVCKMDETIEYGPDEKIQFLENTNDTLIKIEAYENYPVQEIDAFKSFIKQLIDKWTIRHLENIELLKYLNEELAKGEDGLPEYYLKWELEDEPLINLSESLSKAGYFNNADDFFKAIKNHIPVSVIREPETIAYLINQLSAKDYVHANTGTAYTIACDCIFFASISSDEKKKVTKSFLDKITKSPNKYKGIKGFVDNQVKKLSTKTS